jgi:hypothetical protein
MTVSLYEIVSDVPPPPARSNRIYEFDRMLVGQSFLIPAEAREERSVLAQRVRSAVKHYRRRNAPHTLWRTKSTSKGVRVWRVA